jgi:cytochrome c-type biogenesis protein
VVFVALGAGATLLGNLLLTWRYELGIAAGILIVLFGLHMMGLSPLSLMSRDIRWHLDVPGGRVLGAFAMGLAFAFGWTPCIGPVLGVILTMSVGTGDVGQGMRLLTAYAVGLGVPFLLAALFTDVLLERLRRLGVIGRRLQQIAGFLLVVMGLLMLTGGLELIAFWLLETFPVFTRIG